MANLIHSVLPIPPRKIVFVLPDDTIKKCINLMTELDIGSLVCIDNKEKLVGIVSERDIVRTCLHQCIDMNKAKVSDVVYKKVTILTPHDTVEKAMQVMTETKRRHILICEKNKFIAILSIGDLLFHILDHKARVIEHLEQYITT